MIKELKYLFFIIIISLFFFFTIKYYFSDFNKKNSYRSLKEIDNKIISYSENLILLNNDTNNIVKYVTQNIKKKNIYNFWKLKKNND
jgi:flagellar biosynthesis protein FliP